MKLSKAQERTIERINKKPLKGTTKIRVSKMSSRGIATAKYRSDGKAREFKISRRGGIRQ